MKTTETRKAVKEIVEVLHRNRVPISLLPAVFKQVEEDIEIHTVPYSPSLESRKDLATEDITSKATCPTG